MNAYLTHGGEQPDRTRVLAYHGSRLDVPQTGELHDFIAPLVNTGLCYIFILHDIARNQPLLDAMRDTGFTTERSLIEPFNEREKGNVSPQVMIDAVNILYHDCTARGYRGSIIASGDSNLNQDAIDFYRAICPSLPDDCIVAFHDYPRGTQPEHKPWHRTHEEDIELFLGCLKFQQRAANTEFGWHMAMEETDENGILPGGKVQTRLTEQQCYDFLQEYFTRYARYPIDFCCVYQFGDGATDDAMGRYGLYDQNLNPKKQANAWKEWLQRTS